MPTLYIESRYIRMAKPWVTELNLYIPWLSLIAYKIADKNLRLIDKVSDKTSVTNTY